MIRGLRILGLAAALMTAGLAVVPAASAIEADWPTGVADKPSNPETWRHIKEGEKGKASATGADPVLIKPAPGCSDQAVGFTTAVNVNIPVVGTPQGQGPTTGALGLLAAVFGFFFGAGLMVARNLGKHPTAYPEA